MFTDIMIPPGILSIPDAQCVLSAPRCLLHCSDMSSNGSAHHSPHAVGVPASRASCATFLPQHSSLLEQVFSFAAGWTTWQAMANWWGSQPMTTQAYLIDMGLHLRGKLPAAAAAHLPSELQ